MLTVDEMLKIYSVVGVTLGAGLKWLWMAVEARRKEMQAELNLKIEACEKDRTQLIEQVAAIEASMHTDVPCWKKTQEGVIVTVNWEFIRLILMPYGYRKSDVVGKRFDELHKLPAALKDAMRLMDNELAVRKRSSKYNVRFNAESSLTMISAASSSSTGSIIYTGYLIEE